MNVEQKGLGFFPVGEQAEIHVEGPVQHAIHAEQDASSHILAQRKVVHCAYCVCVVRIKSEENQTAIDNVSKMTNHGMYEEVESKAEGLT